MTAARALTQVMEESSEAGSDNETVSEGEVPGTEGLIYEALWHFCAAAASLFVTHGGVKNAPCCTLFTK